MPTSTFHVCASTAYGRNVRSKARTSMDVAGCVVTMVSTTSSPGCSDRAACVTVIRWRRNRALHREPAQKRGHDSSAASLALYHPASLVPFARAIPARPSRAISSTRWRPSCYTWPLVLHPFTLLAAGQGPGDAYLNLWIIGWDLRTLVTHPARLLHGRGLQREHLLPGDEHARVLRSLPAPGARRRAALLRSRTIPCVCYNAVLFFSLVAAAWAMHVTVREIVGSEIGRVDGRTRVGICAVPLRPSHSHSAAGAVRAAARVSVSAPDADDWTHPRRVPARVDARRPGALRPSTTPSSAASAWRCVTLVWLVPGNRHRLARDDRRLGSRASLIGAVLVAPIAYRYLDAQRNEGFGRSLAEAGQGSAGLRAYVTAPPDNLLYGRSRISPAGREIQPAPKATEQMLLPRLCTDGARAARALAIAASVPTRSLAVALRLVGVVGFRAVARP